MWTVWISIISLYFYQTVAYLQGFEDETCVWNQYGIQIRIIFQEFEKVKKRLKHFYKLTPFIVFFFFGNPIATSWSLNNFFKFFIYNPYKGWNNVNQRTLFFFATLTPPVCNWTILWFIFMLFKHQYKSYEKWIVKMFLIYFLS